MRRRPLLPLALLLVLGLFLASCGDDDGGDTVDAGDTSSEDDGGDSGDSASEDDAEDAAEDAIGSQIGGDCAFLGQFASGAGIEEAFDPTALMTPGGTTDFGALFQPLAEEFSEVADAAPSDIQDSFQVLADAFGQLASELEGVELDFSDPQNIDPEALAKFESLGETFDSPELQAASEDVEAWISENCGAPAGS